MMTGAIMITSPPPKDVAFGEVRLLLTCLGLVVPFHFGKGWVGQ